jgi:hypothetical protein
MFWDGWKAHMGQGLTSESEQKTRSDGDGRLIGFKSSEDSTRANLAKACALSGFFFIVPEVLVE